LPIDQKKIGLTPNLGADVRAPGVMGMVRLALRVRRATGRQALARGRRGRGRGRVLYIYVSIKPLKNIDG